MSALRYRPWWQAVGYLIILAIFLLALMPWSPPDAAPADIDKLVHAATFMLLTLWFFGLHERREYLRSALLLVLFGALIEIAQSMTVYRQGDWIDFVADCLGVMAGWAIALAGGWRWCLLIERHLLAVARD